MESPFEHLIGVNYVPTEQEIGIITQLLVKPYQKLSRMDDGIRDMENKLSELRMHRNRLWSSIHAHRGMISCARRLPDDVLQEVFVRTLPTSRLPGMSSTQAPVVLTHVCRRWRELALANPHLWSGIHVSKLARSGDSSDEDRARKFAAIGEWISRSRSVPISVSLESHLDSSPVISAIHNVAPQLQWNGFRVNVRVDVRDAPHATIKDFDTTPLKSAQRISLDLVQVGWHPELWSRFTEVLPCLELSSNRRLRSLTLRHNFEPASFDMKPFIPCSGLTYLDFGAELRRCPTCWHLDMLSFAQLLRQCHNLQVLKTPLNLTTKTQARVPGHFPEDIVHPCMREVLLCMQYITTEGFHAATFLPLIFPSLRVFHLRFIGTIYSRPNRDRDEVPPNSTLSQTLQAASLTSLTIGPESLPEEDLINVLSGLPDLVQLHLLEVPNESGFNKPYGTEIIHFLCPPQSDDTGKAVRGCSKLQYLKLGRNSSTIDDAILPKLLYGRKVCMRQCHIHFRCAKDLSCRVDVGEFSDLTAAGLDLELRYGDEGARKSDRDIRSFSQVDRLVYGWEVD